MRQLGVCTDGQVEPRTLRTEDRASVGSSVERGPGRLEPLPDELGALGRVSSQDEARTVSVFEHLECRSRAFPSSASILMPLLILCKGIQIFLLKN